MKKPKNYLKQVRNQYESYPYPPRKPEEERQRLIRVVLSELAPIHHYCFRGRRRLEGLNVLVAGAGTGDATIFLAEQLSLVGGRVTSLDISEASSRVAKGRAKVRGLDNIDWVHASLLDLPELGLGPFDYINCTGVLHHLEDPDAGLLALKSVLKDDGAMGIMLYGTYGRAGVYQMQDMLRLINQDERDMEGCVKNAKAAVDTVPPTHWLRHNQNLLEDLEEDIGVYDLLLHSHDRSYTVHQLYDFVAGAGLHFGGFAYPVNRLRMDPVLNVTDKRLLQRIQRLSQRDRDAVMEIWSGIILRHTFYITAQPDTAARPEELDLVPYLFGAPYDFARGFAGQLANAPKGKPVTWQQQGAFLSVVPGTYSARILMQIDGNRTLRQVFDRVRAEAGGKAPTDEKLLANFLPVWEAFNRMDFMLLRDPSVPPIADV